MPGIHTFLTPNSGLDWAALIILSAFFLAGLGVLLFKTEISGPGEVLLFGEEIEEAIHTRWAGYVLQLPSLLLVMGLLFTFLGLGLAISEAATTLQAAASQAMVEKLRGVLALIGLKFKASVWGISFHFLAQVMASRIRQRKRKELGNYLQWRDQELRGNLSSIFMHLHRIGDQGQAMVAHLGSMEATSLSLKAGAVAIAQETGKLAGEVKDHRNMMVASIDPLCRSLTDIASNHEAQMAGIAQASHEELRIQAEAMRRRLAGLARLALRTSRQFMDALDANQNVTRQALIEFKEAVATFGETTPLLQKANTEHFATLVGSVGEQLDTSFRQTMETYLTALDIFRNSQEEGMERLDKGLCSALSGFNAAAADHGVRMEGIALAARDTLRTEEEALQRHLTGFARLALRTSQRLQSAMMRNQVATLEALDDLKGAVVVFGETVPGLQKANTEHFAALVCTVENKIEKSFSDAMDAYRDAIQALDGFQERGIERLDSGFSHALDGFNSAAARLDSFRVQAGEAIDKAHERMETQLRDAIQNLGDSVVASQALLEKGTTSSEALASLMEKIQPVLGDLSAQFQINSGNSQALMGRLTDRQEELRIMLGILSQMVRSLQVAAVGGPR